MSFLSFFLCLSVCVFHCHVLWTTLFELNRSTGRVHTCAKARLTSVRIRIRIPPKCSSLFIGPLPTFPENFKFHANQFGSFCAKLLTDRQTYKTRRLHILFGGGNIRVTEIGTVSLPTSSRCVHVNEAGSPAVAVLRHLRPSGIRNMFRITSKIQSIVFRSIICLSSCHKFHQKSARND